jgi:hypothetical protein
MNISYPAGEGALREFLLSRQVRAVAIIDDAYNPAPTVADLQTAGLEALWGKIDASDDALSQLETSGIQFESPADINDAALERLFATRSSAPAIDEILRSLDGIQEGKRKDLQILESLCGRLQCNLALLGPSEDLPQENLPDLIFLDYLLDPRSADHSLPLAREIGNKIKSAYSGTHKPFVVLMSSLNEIKPEMRSLFRETAGLIGGMFHFIPKSEFRNPTMLVLKLAVMIRSIDDGRKIQGFVEALENGILDAVGEFKKKLRSLSVEDYAFMQKISLHGEGQPLGDYLLLLFGTYFGQLVFDAVPEHRKVLDELSFEHIPDAADPPSPDFVELYQNVVSEEVGELGTHPRIPEEGRQQLGEQAPTNAHFGDLFIKSNGEALLVISAECDLAFAPEETAKRAFDPNLSVLLVPGMMQEQSRPLSSTGAVTQFVRHDNKNWRVLWSPKNVRAEALGNLRKLKEEQFERRRRLRLPFATEVQKAFTNQIERVGIPVSPPVLRFGRLELCYQDRDGRTGQTRLDAIEAVSIVTSREKTEMVQLRLPAISFILETLPTVITELEARIANLKGDNKPVQKPENDLALVKGFESDLTAQLKLRSPYGIREMGHEKIGGTPIQIARGLKEEDRERWSNTTLPVLIVVREIEGA